MGYFFRFELPLGAFSPLPVAVGSSDCYDVQAAGFLVVAASALIVDYGAGIVAASAIIGTKLTPPAREERTLRSQSLLRT